jgi:ribosome maturation factor RimP
VGRRVQLKTDRKIDGRNRFKGELVEAADGAVTLSTLADGEQLRIPYDAIVRANLIDEG